MDNNSAFGQLLEKGQNVAVNTISDVTNSLKSQALGDEKSQAPQQATNLNSGNQPEALDQESAEQTREIVRDFYSPSEDSLGQSAPLPNDQEKLAKTRQELQTQQQRYNELHREIYYDPLFAYEQKKAEPTKAQEQEEEKQDKMQDLAQTQAKKDQDIAVQMAAQKVERFPGVSG